MGLRAWTSDTQFWRAELGSAAGPSALDPHARRRVAVRLACRRRVRRGRRGEEEREGERKK